MPRFQQGGPIPHKKPGEGSDAPPTLKRSGSERQEERLHPLPFWKGRGLGSGLRTPSSQEGDRGVEKISHNSLVITKYNRTFVAILAIKMYDHGKRQ